MAERTLKILLFFKELVFKVCDIDDLDINAVATFIKESKEDFGDLIALKRTLANLHQIFEIASQDINQIDSLGVVDVVENIDRSIDITDRLPSTSDASASCNEPPLVDPQFVFLARNKVEIEERIAKYIETKQNDNNEINIREFCGLQPGDSAESGSCARTSSVFQPRSGHSHMIVQKVVNRCGPQVKIKPSRRLRHSPAPERVSSDYQVQHVQPKVESLLPPSVEERLTNMELHMKVYNGKPVPRDVYDRLRHLENRITYLESVSPEYFDHNAKSASNEMVKKPKVEPYEVSSDDIHMFKNLSPTEVDRKITQLRLQLTRRARELQTLQTK